MTAKSVIGFQEEDNIQNIDCGPHPGTLLGFNSFLTQGSLWVLGNSAISATSIQVTDKMDTVLKFHRHMLSYSSILSLLLVNINKQCLVQICLFFSLGISSIAHCQGESLLVLCPRFQGSVGGRNDLNGES